MLAHAAIASAANKAVSTGLENCLLAFWLGEKSNVPGAYRIADSNRNLGQARIDHTGNVGATLEAAF
jgi:hypothetical protein